MDESRVEFAALPWEEGTAGARSKARVRGGRKLRLVEFTDEFAEPGWCETGHVGDVLEGEIEIRFTDRAERLTAGDGLFILGGERERHKAKVIGRVAKLVLVEDIP